MKKASLKDTTTCNQVLSLSCDYQECSWCERLYDTSVECQCQCHIKEVIDAALKLYDRSKGMIVSVKMSRETYRRLINSQNIMQADTNRIFGIPIVFDDEIPINEIRETNL